MGTFGPAQTVETGTRGGSEYLAIGPSALPAVPEASQAVSLGLLLALGVGGVVVARKKWKA